MTEEKNAPAATNGDSLQGFLFALTAYVLWGFLPFFMKAVAHIPASEVVAHRILWSVLLLGLLATFWRRWGAIRAALGSGQVLVTLIVTACLIAVNWLVYIYAIVSGHVLEGSLGYYLNPLVNVLFGVLLFACGLAVAALERAGAPMPRALGVCLLALTVLGVVLMPASGFWLAFPPAVVILVRAGRDGR